MQVYVEGPGTHAVQTAWAMLALIYAGQVWFFLLIFLLIGLISSWHITNWKTIYILDKNTLTFWKIRNQALQDKIYIDTSMNMYVDQDVLDLS